MALGVQNIERNGQHGQRQDDLAVEKTAKAVIRPPDAAAVPAIMTCMRIIFGPWLADWLTDNGERQYADRHQQKADQKAKRVALWKAAVRAGQQTAQQAVHAQAAHAGDAACIAE